VKLKLIFKKHNQSKKTYLQVQVCARRFTLTKENSK